MNYCTSSISPILSNSLIINFPTTLWHHQIDLHSIDLHIFLLSLTFLVFSSFFLSNLDSMIHHHHNFFFFFFKSLTVLHLGRIPSLIKCHFLVTSYLQYITEWGWKNTLKHATSSLFITINLSWTLYFPFFH